MSARIKSIDVIRGLSIIGMVLCASYPANCGLPNWMFHCQVPPPDCIFTPEIRGITWVDLVFPFFLFSMGAAFPFSLGKKLEKGESLKSIILGLVKRWITLSLFSLAIGNAYGIYGSGSHQLLKLLFLIGLWAGFFLSLVRTDRRWLNFTGWILLAGLFLVEHFCFKVDLSLHNTDIIIMIMALVSIVGGLIWLATQKKRGLRLLIFAFIIAVKSVAYHSDALDFLALPYCINWLINWSFLQYLAIVLPASLVGDLLRKSSSEEAPTSKPACRCVGADWILPLAVILQLWGFYSRHVMLDFALTAVLALAYVLLTHKETEAKKIIAYWGFAFLIAGIACDPLDGGIAKDHCNVSYLLSTGGMAALVTSFLLSLEKQGHEMKALSLLGQNPMLAYTVNGFFISPLLYACGLLGTIDALSAGNIFWGLVRAALVVSLMCVVTCIFSRKKIYWRS